MLCYHVTGLHNDYHWQVLHTFSHSSWAGCSFSAIMPVQLVSQYQGEIDASRVKVNIGNNDHHGPGCLVTIPICDGQRDLVRTGNQIGDVQHFARAQWPI